MRPKLIIDGNAVYEIDEGCMRRKQIDYDRENCFSGKSGKEQKGKEEIEKRDHIR